MSISQTEATSQAGTGRDRCPTEFDLVPARVQSPCPPCDEFSWFVVVGVVHGAERSVRVRGPAAALEVMVAWLLEDGDAGALWYLDNDLSDPVNVVGRAAPGTIGETRRSVHLFPLTPGKPQYGSVTAFCGAELELPSIEWVELGQGMPCTSCMVSSQI